MSLLCGAANQKLKQMVADQQEAEKRKVMSQELHKDLQEQQKRIAAKQSEVMEDLAKVEPAVQEAQQGVYRNVCCLNFLCFYVFVPLSIGVGNVIKVLATAKLYLVARIFELHILKIKHISLHQHPNKTEKILNDITHCHCFVHIYSMMTKFGLPTFYTDAIVK